MLIKKNDIYLCLILILFFCVEIIGNGYLLLLIGPVALLGGIRKRGNWWTITFLLLLFQTALQRLTTGVIYQAITYLDEVAEAVIFLMLLHAVTQKFLIQRRDKRILTLFFLWLGITVYSSIINHNAGIINMVLDCFVCVKFMIFYQGGRVLSKSGRFTGINLYEMLNSACKITSVILLLLCVHDLMLNPFFEKYDYRYFTESLQLCFLHPTYLAAVCMTCMAILMYNMKFDQRNMKYIIMLVIVTGLTFRTKAICALFVVFAVYFSSIKYELKMKSIALIAAVCLAIYFGMGQVEKYFTVGTDIPIRLKMMRDGVSIAQQYFPLGGGFGTYGTTVAYDSGSSFYYNLGYMSGHYAGQPVGDVFWPGIFAESGWIGTVFFGGMIIFMAIDSVKRLKEDKYAGWCMLSILAYAIIASTAETAFFNPATAFMFLIYGIAANRSYDFAEEHLTGKKGVK